MPDVVSSESGNLLLVGVLNLLLLSAEVGINSIRILRFNRVAASQPLAGVLLCLRQRGLLPRLDRGELAASWRFLVGIRLAWGGVDHVPRVINEAVAGSNANRTRARFLCLCLARLHRLNELVVGGL